jgi:hypothetical protein
MFFPDTHRTGAPTGEDYERWVTKAGILGASPGIANILSFLIAVFTKKKKT